MKNTRRARSLSTLGLVVILATGINVRTAVPHSTELDRGTAEITAAAVAFLDSLSVAQTRAISFSVDAAERRDWHYTPRRRPGVRLDELNQDQRRLGWQLMRAALSEVGYDKARSVIILEEILGEITGRPDFRDPDNYAFAVFGSPQAVSPWGWRFEGHHLSLSFTVVPGNGVAFTPAFFGTNPAVVPQGSRRAGWRVLEQEHELAFALLSTLTEEQLATALIDDQPPGDIVAGPGNEARITDPVGLPFGNMTAAQRSLALRLVRVYVNNVGADFARRELDKMEAAGVDTIHFAWAGSSDPEAPHYYRIHGPTVLIEYDNRGNHVHSVWHDPADLFGEDLLGRHLAEHDH